MVSLSSGLTGFDQVRLEYVKSGQKRSGQIRLGHTDTLGKIMLFYIRSGQACLYHVGRSQARLESIKSCSDKAVLVKLGHEKLV